MKRVIILFLALISLYTFLDNYGYQNYQMLLSAFGYVVFLLTISLNIIISLLSAVTIDLALKNSLSTAGIGAGIGNTIAAFFTGCASCGLSFLAVIGINVSLPVITPGAIEFKLVALFIISVSYLITKRNTRKGCAIK